MHDVGVDDVGKEEFPLIFSAMSSKLLLLPPPVCPDFFFFFFALHTDSLPLTQHCLKSN